MYHALTLAERALGRTAPNPAVGCVIVSPDGRVVGRGWTQDGGRPHAEAVALAQAGSTAKGATAYVTLEPCAHLGRTPPCAEALVKAGVARVVACIEDPDPRVQGKGFAILCNAGIEVVTGILQSEAA
jgi:diaminohydroxyphosphoribosylaminopyrimidine deaminase / 5-amino-6-(5-phosphoribosylamino)uracil reductase